LPAYEKFIKEFGIRPKVIIQKNAPKFQTQWLEILGVKTDDLIEIIRPIKVKNLLVPSQHNTPIPNSYSKNNFYLLDKRSFDWIRDKVNIIIPKINDRKKFFISRPDNLERRITNENELFLMLKNYGFEMLHLEQMTVKDQIHKFSNSSFLIGAHGAAFSNLIVSSKCVVIELYPEGRYSESTMTYYQISQMYGLIHYLITSECTINHENIKADVALIEKIVKECINSNNISV
jgi:capsular polysaccharide biosynthesis protein